MFKKNRNHGRPGRGIGIYEFLMRLYIQEISIHSLFGFTLQDRWELFHSLGGKYFHWGIFSRSHERVVIGCVTWLFWVVLLCSLLYTAILALNLYAYVNFNDLYLKRNRLDFGEH